MVEGAIQPLCAVIWSVGTPGRGGPLPLWMWQPVQSTFGRLLVSTWQVAQAVTTDRPLTVTVPRYACESVGAIGKRPTWFCAAIDRSTCPFAWQGRQVLLYAVVTGFGNGW